MTRLLAAVGVLDGSACRRYDPGGHGDACDDRVDNPRGLSFGADGGLYVAEAGRGGSGPPCRVWRGESMCYGPTAAISRLLHRRPERVDHGPAVARRPSGADAEGGPQDITFAGNTSFRGPGDAYFTMGHGGPATARDALGAARRSWASCGRSTSGRSRGAGRPHRVRGDVQPRGRARRLQPVRRHDAAARHGRRRCRRKRRLPH